MGGEDFGLHRGNDSVLLGGGSHYVSQCQGNEDQHRARVNPESSLRWLPFVEEGGDEHNDIWDAGRATDRDDLVDVSLVRLGITDDLLDGVGGASEEAVT